MEVVSNNVSRSATEITSTLPYTRTKVVKTPTGGIQATPVTHTITMTTSTVVPKLGVMLVGWGGCNGSTVTAACIANREKITWRTKTGEKKPNYLGSITQASTVRVGVTDSNEEVYTPMNEMVPMVHPNDIVFGGWDISKDNLAVAMEKAAVLECTLQDKLKPYMEQLTPLPAVFDPDFIASNQQERATNVLPPTLTKSQVVEKLRSDIRDFKAKSKVDKVIVLWTATTERFVAIEANLNTPTSEVLLAAIERNEKEISPSTLYGVAAVLEGSSYINGSPQNTCVPGLIDLANKHNVFLAGDDFKSGQTKFKSVFVEFLVSAGLKPECIASYNHLGNNDGRNLSAPAQFRSKEISKSNVVDDMVASNRILYPDPEKDKPDHLVVIKYLPFVGDSKRALDEYTCSIFMNGLQTFVLHNTCEDSLLAAPLILDLTILCELMERVRIGIDGKPQQRMHTVASLLSYLTKAPLVPEKTPLVNALFRQKQAIDNFIRALIGLPPDHNMLLEYKTQHAWE